MAMFLLALLALLFSTAVDSRDVAPILHSDPFERPDLLLQPKPELEAELEIQPDAGTWQPELRATMRSSKGSMVNIGGEIIAIGEQIDGFRLLEVQERTAIFDKGGQHYPVSLDDAWKKESEERERPRRSR